MKTAPAAYFILTHSGPNHVETSVLLASLEEVHSLQSSMLNFLSWASVVTVHSLGGLASYVWEGQGFRRRRTFSGNRSLAPAFISRFEESQGSAGSFLVQR